MSEITFPRIPRGRRTQQMVAALLIVGAALGVWVSPASAHGDEGELTVTAFEASGPAQVRIEAGIVYEGDGHLAQGAQVSATLSGPDGGSVASVPLERESDTSSLYEATTPVPSAGTWTATVTSTEPEGEATATVEVPLTPASTTTAPTTTAAPNTAQTPEGPQDEAVGVEDRTGVAAATTDGDSGPIGAPLIAAIVIGALLAVGVGYVLMQRRNSI